MPLFGSSRAAPPTVESDRIYQLWEFDDTKLLQSFMLRVLFKFDDVLDPEKLQSSLTKLLNRPDWSRLGGRLRKNKAGKLEYHVPVAFDENRPAFTFTHVQHDISIKDHELASKIPGPSEQPAVVVESGEKFVPLMEGPGVPKHVNDYLYSDLPQLEVYLVSFTDATLMTVAWPHTLADAMGFGEILKAWSLVLQGRDDEVPPLYGAERDPLKGLGRNATEPYVQENRVLKSFRMLLFAVCYIWDLVRYPKDDGRVVCIPKATIDKLHKQVNQELLLRSEEDEMEKDQTDNPRPSFLSEGDVICAWILPLVTRHLISPNSNRTISLMNAYNLRTAMKQNVLPSPAVAVANFVFGAWAQFKAKDLFTSSLTDIAIRIRQSITEVQSQEQIEALVASHRRIVDSTGMPPVVGDGTTHLVTVSNWTKARIFQTDFSAAIVETNTKVNKQDQSRGRPTYINPFSYVHNMSVRNSICIAGKDNGGNYWILSGLRKGIWNLVEKDIIKLNEADMLGETTTTTTVKTD